MILIFGGAYQGKLEYAVSRFELSGQDIYRCSIENADMPDGKRLIYEIDKWILALIRAERYSEDALRQYVCGLGEAVVICNDISCGVVPFEREMRAWREAVGRTLAVLSNKSEEVIRLYCGIPARIK